MVEFAVTEGRPNSARGSATRQIKKK